MNDWSGVYYVNYWGCDEYNGGYYHPADADETWRCDYPELAASSGFATIYFMSFVLIAGVVMLSMFVSTISLAMGESIQELNEQVRMKKAEKRRAKQLQKQNAILLGTPVDSAVLPTHAQKKKAQSVSAINKLGLLSASLKELMTGEKHVYVNQLEPTALRRRLVMVGSKATKIHNTRKFRATMVTAVVVSSLSIVAGAKRDATAERDIHEVIIDHISNTVFSLEFVCTVLKYDVRPWLYFANAINVFDFVVLMGSFGVIPGGAQAFSLLRLFRLLLILRLAKKSPGLRIAVGTLVNGAASITYVAFMLFLTYFMFGNVAWLFFNENDPVKCCTAPGIHVLGARLTPAFVSVPFWQPSHCHDQPLSRFHHG
jgi:hypothetical protein